MFGSESQISKTLSPSEIFKKLGDEQKDLKLLPTLRTEYIAYIHRHADELPDGWLKEPMTERDAASFMDAIVQLLEAMADALAPTIGTAVYGDASVLAQEIQALLADVYGFQRCTFRFRPKAPAVDM